MKNNEVVEAFLSGNDAKTKNVFSKSLNGVNVLYFYGNHFPMALTFKDGFRVINYSNWSETTSRHKGLLARDLGFDNFKDLLLNHDKNKIRVGNTEYLTKVLRSGLKTRIELIEAEICN